MEDILNKIIILNDEEKINLFNNLNDLEKNEFIHFYLKFCIEKCSFHIQKNNYNKISIKKSNSFDNKEYNIFHIIKNFKDYILITDQFIKDNQINDLLSLQFLETINGLELDKYTFLEIIKNLKLNSDEYNDITVLEDKIIRNILINNLKRHISEFDDEDKILIIKFATFYDILLNKEDKYFFYENIGFYDRMLNCNINNLSENDEINFFINNIKKVDPENIDAYIHQALFSSGFLQMDNLNIEFIKLFSLIHPELYNNYKNNFNNYIVFFEDPTDYIKIFDLVNSKTQMDNF